MLFRSGWSLRNFFLKQSEQYAIERNDKLFYINLDTAVDYVKTVVGNGLGGTIAVYSRLQDDVAGRATEEAENLLSARNGNWRSGFTISRKRRVLTRLERGLPPINYNHVNFITM